MPRKPNYGPETKQLINDTINRLKIMGVTNISDHEVIEAAIQKVPKDFIINFVEAKTPIEHKIKTLSKNDAFMKDLEKLTKKHYSSISTSELITEPNDH